MKNGAHRPVRLLDETDPAPMIEVATQGLAQTEKKSPGLFKSQAFVQKVDDIWNLVREEAMKMQGVRTS